MLNIFESYNQRTLDWDLEQLTFKQLQEIWNFNRFGPLRLGRGTPEAKRQRLIAFIIQKTISCYHHGDVFMDASTKTSYDKLLLNKYKLE